MWNGNTTSNLPIKLDERLRKVFPRWSLNPESFFKPVLYKGNLGKNTPIEICQSLATLETGEIVPVIQRRIFLVSLGHLKEKLGTEFTKLCTHIAEELGTHMTQDRIKEWAKAGQRYAQLATDLDGYGKLALLPFDISRTM